MRILFISPNRLRLIVAPLPLGLASVVASLGPEHTFRVLDFMFAADPLGQLRREIAEFQPEIIGLSVRNIDNQDSHRTVSYFPEVKELVDRLRELTPAPIVLGGGGFSVMPREFLEFTGADCGIVGEGESAFQALLAAYEHGGPREQVPGLAWRTGAGWQLNPPHRVPQLDRLPPPALEYFTPRLYQDTVGTYVKLDLHPEVSFPSGVANGTPIRSLRSSNTVANVRDGQTLVVGGIITEDEQNAVTKVPGVGDLPILGHLFKTKEKTKFRTELMIFVTPTVHRRPEEITWDQMVDVAEGINEQGLAPGDLLRQEARKD